MTIKDFNQQIPYHVLAEQYLRLYNQLKGKDFKAILLFDLDEVLALLMQDWADVYNFHYDDNKKVEDFDKWETDQIVKPECGMKVYDFLKHPGLFRYLKPTPHSQEVMQRLVDNDYEIFIVSDSPTGHSHCEGIETLGNPADDKRNGFGNNFR